MEINVANLYIDAAHRLPSSGRGPRPVIIKYISKLDCDMVGPEKLHLVQIYSYKNTLMKKTKEILENYYSLDVLPSTKAKRFAWSRID